MTYRELILAIKNMRVSGVTTILAAPPDKLDTADLPALFPLMPSQQATVGTFSSYLVPKTKQLQLALFIGPVGQSTLADDYNLTIELMDAVDDAMIALDGSITDSLSWRSDAGVLSMGETNYRGITITLTLEG